MSNIGTPEVSVQDKEYLHILGYDVQRYGGSGNFGKVFMGICNESAFRAYKDDETNQWNRKPLSGRAFALKWLDPSTDPKANQVREAQILVDLCHPNVVEIFAMIEVKQDNQTNELNRYIITEYINGRTLDEMMTRINQYSHRLSESEAHSLFEQMINGLEYIHGKGIQHFDIHLKNVMLHNTNFSKSYQGIIKYIDFGFAQYDQDKYGPQMGIKVDYVLDIREIGIIFQHLIGVTNMTTTGVVRELRRVFNRMKIQMIEDMESLTKELRPILDKMETLSTIRPVVPQTSSPMSSALLTPPLTPVESSNLGQRYPATPPLRTGFMQTPPQRTGFTQTPPLRTGFMQTPPQRTGFTPTPPHTPVEFNPSGFQPRAHRFSPHTTPHPQREFNISAPSFNPRPHRFSPRTPSPSHGELNRFAPSFQPRAHRFMSPTSPQSPEEFNVFAPRFQPRTQRYPSPTPPQTSREFNTFTPGSRPRTHRYPPPTSPPPPEGRRRYNQ